MKKPSYDLIVAALDLIVMHYQPMIEKASRGNPVIHKQISDQLREAILHYDLNNPAANEEYLISQKQAAME